MPVGPDTVVAPPRAANRGDDEYGAARAAGEVGHPTRIRRENGIAEPARLAVPVVRGPVDPEVPTAAVADENLVIGDERKAQRAGLRGPRAGQGSSAAEKRGEEHDAGDDMKPHPSNVDATAFRVWIRKRGYVGENAVRLLF